jgi:hypothetical protein
VKDSELVALLKRYWALLQRFYDADKQCLPKWDDGMFKDQNKIEEVLSRDAPECGKCKFFSYPFCKRRAPVRIDNASTWPEPPKAHFDWCGEFEKAKGPDADKRQELISEKLDDHPF